MESTVRLGDLLIAFLVLFRIGERNFIYDLWRRTVLSQWRREEVNNPVVSFGPTGWVSEAGPNRVAIGYQSAAKGFSDRTTSIYTDPSLN